VRATTRLVLLLSSLLFPVACSHGGSGGGGGRPLLQAQSLAGTNWTLASVEGAPSPVSGSFQFDNAGSYTFAFAAGGVQIQGNGTFNFDGTFLRCTGPVQQIVSSGVLTICANSSGQFVFADDDDDLWVWNGQFGALAQPSGSCIPVRQGAWEFEIEYLGLTALQFVEGNLSQSGCVLSYDDDAIFFGLLSDAEWTVNAPKAGIRFVGTFTGSPANQFTGTWTDAQGRADQILGTYVGN
jgi:hypothetical protein